MILQYSILSIIEILSKIYKLIIYKEVINKSVYKQSWWETIKEKLQSLEDQHI